MAGVRVQKNSPICGCAERIRTGEHPLAYVQQRDDAMRAAKIDPQATLKSARRVSEPWYRCQALAAVARWIDDEQVDTIAGEAIAAALEQTDAYKRSAVLAWPIAALVARERSAQALQALAMARQIAATAARRSSRAYALAGLAAAAHPLGPETRRSLVLELAGLQREDSFWRVSQSLIDALALVKNSDGDLVQEVIAGMQDERWIRRAKALVPASPRQLF